MEQAHKEALEVAAKLAEHHYVAYENSARMLVKKIGDEIAQTIRRMIHNHGETVMTTHVKVHVKGKYRAHVNISHASGDQEEHIVDGNGVGDATGELTINLRHPADAVIRVSEEPVE